MLLQVLPLQRLLPLLWKLRTAGGHLHEGELAGGILVDRLMKGWTQYNLVIYAYLIQQVCLLLEHRRRGPSLYGRPLMIYSILLTTAASHPRRVMGAQKWT